MMSMGKAELILQFPPVHEDVFVEVPAAVLREVAKKQGIPAHLLRQAERDWESRRHSSRMAKHPRNAKPRRSRSR